MAKYDKLCPIWPRRIKYNQIEPNKIEYGKLGQEKKYRNVFPILSMGSWRKETTDLQIMTKYNEIRKKLKLQQEQQQQQS